MKANQPDLLETLTAEFASDGVSPWERKIVAAERQIAVTTNKAHGRLETRTLTGSTALHNYVDWPDLAQAFEPVRTRQWSSPRVTSRMWNTRFSIPQCCRVK